MSQTTAAKTTMPQWMIAAGMIAGVIGAIIMFAAHGKLKKAENVEAFTAAMGGPPGSPQIDAATTWGYIGFGVLIFGAALALAGLVVMAVKR
jgi:hypothetical protein